jgi:hypothetical protein
MQGFSPIDLRAFVSCFTVSFGFRRSIAAPSLGLVFGLV